MADFTGNLRFWGFRIDLGVPKTKWMSVIASHSLAKQSPGLREIASAELHRLAMMSRFITSRLGIRIDFLLFLCIDGRNRLGDEDVHALKDHQQGEHKIDDQENNRHIDGCGEGRQVDLDE